MASCVLCLDSTGTNNLYKTKTTAVLVSFYTYMYFRSFVIHMEYSGRNKYGLVSWHVPVWDPYCVVLIYTGKTALRIEIETIVEVGPINQAFIVQNLQ